ncbi:MAG: methyltransferase domain-containing protein [Ancrocorticia sp.]|nr:methyltransferase domain-containing protein [Ancrocorticia sp.]MCI2012004.1 methyltransferase domain-containing protein [Ancrocorticia sp.]MCI2029476.1 methyltransferase domain-containing protein [Ancrocorticia sp.]
MATKEMRIRTLLGRWPDITWLSPKLSNESAFRNKAKLVVGGTSGSPTLGILDSVGRGVDLRSCGLYEPALAALLPRLADFIARANLDPFDVPTGKGELKNILITIAPSGQAMVRFVLRSTGTVARIRKHLPWLLHLSPQLRVVSANILPERKAVPEGEQEILLTEHDALPMLIAASGITLYLRPQSFFQTNTAIAEALYMQARAWVQRIAEQEEHPPTITDLYCGVGGFALHCAGPGRRVHGIEISHQAVESAQLSANFAHLDAQFFTGDATAWAPSETDVLIVNPPRRGIGPLTHSIARSAARHLIYSSCNAETLARDMANMPEFSPLEARFFDMFPQTRHSETMVLLNRNPGKAQSLPRIR